MKNIFFICLFLSMSLAVSGKKAQVSISCLKTEMLVNPQNIDCPSPRLSWEILSDVRDVRQVSYHILVSTSLEKLNREEGDLWDTGDVASDQSAYISYGGDMLDSRTQCYWKVRVKTNKGISAWSEPASWEMGLLHPSDWQAVWIGRAFPQDKLEGNTRVPARYLRKPFNLNSKKVRKATLYICGLGFYEAYINGKKIGDQVLAPTPTDYSKSVKYNRFDVTGQLLKGANAIGVILGNGRYTSMRMPGVRHFDVPKMIA